MSAPLLYHVMNNLLHKGELIDSNFVLWRYGSNRMTGPVLQVKLNNDHHMVVYVRHGSETHFQTMSEADAELLHLVKRDDGTWSLENAPKLESSVEEALDEEAVEDDLDKPIAIDMIQALLRKGERVEFTWRAPMEYTSGPITDISWDEHSAKRGFHITYRDITQDGEEEHFQVERKYFDKLQLTKVGNGWSYEPA